MAFAALNPLLFSKAFTLAALTVCPVMDAPRVEALFAADKPFYSEHQSSAALKTHMSKDRESTLATDNRSTVFGVTTSVTSDRFRVSFKTLTDENGDECLYVEKATFWITYSPAIFVSSDILDLPCSLQVAQAHERQHVAIDIAAIREYLPHIKMDMLSYLRSLGYQGFGPFSKKESEKRQQELTDKIVAASAPMIEKLKEARRKRQGVIDTPENYRRESAKCPEDAAAIMKKFHGGR